VPLVLTTVTNGTVIDATAVQGYIDQIEYYLNEGIDNADLDGSPWVDSVHVLKPEFYGSPSPRTVLASGMTQYYAKSDSLYTAASFHYKLGRDGALAIPGLQATIKIPQNDTRVKVLASFAAYEWGGSQVADEGGTLAPSYVVAAFHLYQDGVQFAHTGRRLYQSGETPGTDDTSLLGGMVARKQICMADYVELDRGTHDIGVRVRVYEPPVPPSTSVIDWKHVFIVQRNFVVDYHLR
jgi:hypothetical protein